jgi:hypothetical protein
MNKTILVFIGIGIFILGVATAQIGTPPGSITSITGIPASYLAYLTTQGVSSVRITDVMCNEGQCHTNITIGNLYKGGISFRKAGANETQTNIARYEIRNKIVTEVEQRINARPPETVSISGGNIPLGT